MLIGIILVILNLSVKMPVVNIWLIIKVIGLIYVVFIILIIFDEIPSDPQLVLGASLSIIDIVISSFTFLNWKLLFSENRKKGFKGMSFSYESSCP